MAVYKDKNTKNWVVTLRYRDHEDKIRRRAKRGFKTKKEAKSWEEGFLKSIQTSSKLYQTLDDFYIRYLGDINHKIRSSTKIHKQRIYRLYIKETLGHKIIEEISNQDILKWHSFILSKNYKPSFSRSIHNQLTAVFNHAVRYYDLKENPMHKTEAIGSEKHEPIKVWTQDDFDTFIKVVDNPLYKMSFITLFYTGIRIGELIALKYKDVNLEKGYLDINQTARFIKGEYIFSQPKTKTSKRIVTLPSFLVKLFKDYFNTFENLEEDDQIFKTCKNKMWYYMDIYAKRAKIDKIRIHDLRHSHASLLINQGIQPIIVQERLGHDTIQTTLRTYAHLYPNKQYELAAFIDDIVTNKISDQINTNSVLMIDTTQ